MQWCLRDLLHFRKDNAKRRNGSKTYPVPKYTRTILRDDTKTKGTSERDTKGLDLLLGLTVGITRSSVKSTDGDSGSGGGWEDQRQLLGDVDDEEFPERDAE